MAPRWAHTVGLCGQPRGKHTPVARDSLACQTLGKGPNDDISPWRRRQCTEAGEPQEASCIKAKLYAWSAPQNWPVALNRAPTSRAPLFLKLALRLSVCLSVRLSISGQLRRAVPSRKGARIALAEVAWRAPERTASISGGLLNYYFAPS